MGAKYDLERRFAEVDNRPDPDGRYRPEDRCCRISLAERRRRDTVQRARYMTLETIAPLSDDPAVNLPALAD